MKKQPRTLLVAASCTSVALALALGGHSIVAREPVSDSMRPTVVEESVPVEAAGDGDGGASAPATNESEAASSAGSEESAATLQVVEDEQGEAVLIEELSSTVEEVGAEELVPKNADGTTPVDAVDEVEQAGFTMPEDADYEPGVVLVLVDPAADPAAVQALLESTEGVVAHEVTRDEMELGLVEAGLEEGVSVEDAVNEIMAAGSDAVLGAQPNYRYVALGLGTAANLRELTEPQLLSAQEAQAIKAGEDEERKAVAGESAAAEGQRTHVADGEVLSERQGGSEDTPAGSSASKANEPASADGAGASAADSGQSGASEGAASPSVEDEAVSPAREGDAEASGDAASVSAAPDATSAAPQSDGATNAELGTVEAQEAPVSSEAQGTSEAQGDAEASADPDAAELAAQAVTKLNDPRSDDQWALASVKAYEAWALSRSNHKVTVAVVDGGVDVGHEDLRANLLSSYAYNAASSRQGASYVAPDSVLYNHATHVSGIIAATANNGVGVAGVSYNAYVLPIKIFSGSSASTASVVRAFNYLMSLPSSLNLKVVNLSVGMRYTGSLSATDRAAVEAIKKAYQQNGIVTVCAAGNSELAPVPFQIYPADFGPIVSVINLERSGSSVRRASNSNYNANDTRLKNISAPGTGILSTVPATNAYSTMSGTSMAAPCVSGVLALEFASNPSLTAAQAVSALYSTATDLGSSGWDRQYGYGEANAASAVAKSRSGAASIDISGADITLSQDGYVYDGSAKRPAVSVSVDGITLAEGIDYTLEYANNVNIGTATVTVRASGSYYTGSATRSFRIARYTVASASVSLSPASFTYTGDACKPKVTVRTGQGTLREGIDYHLSFSSNVNAGTASAIVAGKGDYIGKVTKTFPIARRSIADAQISVAFTSATYTGEPLEPSVSVRLGSRTLAAGSDYEVSYQNNVRVGTATVTVSGTGNYANSVTKTFSIRRGTAAWKRLQGQAALDTMVSIVREGGFATGGNVVLATIDGYWDALTAAGIAGMAEAPVLMTSSTALSAQTSSLLSTLRPKKIIACGGTLALSDEVLSAAGQAAGGAAVTRVWGQNAIETANEIYQQAQSQTGGSWGSVGMVCTSEGYWDALSAAPVAYARHMPIFLSAPSGISSGTISAMRQGGITKVYLVGGTLALTPAVETGLRNAGIQVLGRLYGQTAIETSAKVAEFGLSNGLSANHVGVATAGGYWDALAGAALCGKRGGVLILVNDAKSSSIASVIGAHKVDIAHGYVFGGRLAVSDDAYKAVVAASA